MTDAQLSKELAFALGYAPESVRKINILLGHGIEVYGAREPYFSPYWKRFDYRDPTIVVPLIKWLGEQHGIKVMPFRDDDSGALLWEARSPLRYGSREVSVAATLEEAVARAVIAVKGKP